MGLIHVTVALRAIEKSRKKYEAVFLVDTGAAGSIAPASQLKKVGIRRRGRMGYELADGSTVEYDFGLAEIEFMGEITAGRVIFGPENCEPPSRSDRPGISGHGRRSHQPTASAIAGGFAKGYYLN